MKTTLPNSDVTTREVHDLRRKLVKMFPEGHHYRNAMMAGAKAKRRQKTRANQEGKAP